MLDRALARPLGWALLGTVLCTPLLLGCFQQANRAGRATPSAGTPDWVVNAPPSTGFQVSMPGRAQTETSVETEIDGAKASVVEGHLVSGPMYFEYAVRTVEGGVAGEVEDLREPAAQRLSARRSFNDVRVREERSYRDDTGYRVLERVFDSQTDNGLAFTAYIRVYVGRARVIRTMVALPTANERAYVAQTSYFFDSVRLDPADAASPAGDGRYDPNAWSWAYPPEGGFAAYYPGLPRYESSTFMHEDEERTIHRYVVSGAGGSPVFAVRAIHYGERPPDEAFNSARGSWTSSGWEILDERPSQRTGYGGLELALEKEGRRARVRYYVTNVGIYEVYVERADAPGADLDRAERRFFASFRML